MAPCRDKWIRRFVINETMRHEQGFTIYKVTSMIYLKSSPNTASNVSVWKRYNDFKKLHINLKTLHGTLHMRESYPSFPKPKFFGRFEAEVIERRREWAVKFLEFIARHPPLFTNDIFVAFFETSLGNDSIAGRSRSLSPTTSEDDKGTTLESSGDTSDTTSHTADRTPNQPNIDSGKKFEKNDAQNYKVLPILCGKLSDSSIDQRVGDNYKVLCNNNVDNSSQGVRWENLFSYEAMKKVESKTKSPLECSETFAMNNRESNFLDTGQDSAQYILIAAAHMSAGLRHEAIAEYEEAFMQYKLGTSYLRQGVQNDRNVIRAATIQDKIIKYSERADGLYNKHLNCNITAMSRPASELQHYKVLNVIGSVMLVNDIHRKTTLVIKTVEKPTGIREDIGKYILRGKVPYMVQLHACIQTESTVFLILQYASGGKLWDFLQTRYAIPCGKILSRRKNCGKSSKRINTSLDALRGQPNDLDRACIPNVIDAKELKEETTSLRESGREFRQKSEERLNGKSMSDEGIPTTTLLEKSLRLLKSVDATIKKSNSIATSLNECRQLLYETVTADAIKGADDSEHADGSGHLKELSTSDGDTDLIAGPARFHNTEDRIVEKGMHQQTSTYYTCNTQRTAVKTSEIKNRCPFQKNDDENLLNHDEDSGIEMEQELWRIPEISIKSLAARMLLTLDSLHQQGVIVSDLKPNNLLVDESSEILLTYIVPHQNHQLLRYEKPYSAPELCMYLPNVPASTAADVWSFGVILYELFTGIPFQSQHRMPFHSHSILVIPSDLSDSAKQLLTKILRFDPSERLTISEIKRLPFFEKTDWLGMLNA